MIARYYYAMRLGEDEEIRRDGSGSPAVYAAVVQQLREANVPVSVGFPVEGTPVFGITERELYRLRENVAWVLPAAKEALARGDVFFVEDEIDELLDLFGINLDRTSLAYRKLGLAVLGQDVKALEDTARRNDGDYVATPEIIEPTFEWVAGAPLTRRCADTPDDVLTVAYEGGKRQGNLAGQ